MLLGDAPTGSWSGKDQRTRISKRHGRSRIVIATQLSGRSTHVDQIAFMSRHPLELSPTKALKAGVKWALTQIRRTSRRAAFGGGNWLGGIGAKLLKWTRGLPISHWIGFAFMMNERCFARRGYSSRNSLLPRLPPSLSRPPLAPTQTLALNGETLVKDQGRTR